MLRVGLAVLAGCSFTPGTFGGPIDAPTGGSADADPNAGDAEGPDTPVAGIQLVQGAVATNAGNNQVVLAAFPGDQTAGHLNVVVISWSDQNDLVAGVSDAHFQTYFSANTLMQAQGFSQRIYYAPNIAAGANVISVAMTNTVASPKLRIFEYAGIATSLPVDMSMGANGNSNTASAGPLNTTTAHELLFAAEVGSVGANGPGPDFTQRQLDNGDLVEDRIVDTTGAYSATAPLTTNGGWIMQLVSFKGI